MRDSQFREELGKNRQTAKADRDESRAFVGSKNKSKVVDVAEEMTGGEDAAEREEEALEEGRKSLISNMEIPDLQSRMEKI
ncbi:hypothetical protein D5086_000312 [Populus alba]|uniref:Uncharacterized protein n=1 Tax=Populus alba TaxID=43335 RepID=A0ACC4CVL1_POPAL